MNKLAFSEKYDQKQALAYYQKHQSGWQRQWSNRREMQMARRALKLAGEPRAILDLPCGAGRFWPLLAQDQNRQLWASDYSSAMLELAQQVQPPEIVARFRCFQSSAFHIEMEPAAVDCVFSMRLLHHIGQASDRLQIYREFYRVSRQSACISMWVDGNYKAWRRKRLEKARQTGMKPAKPYTNRFVLPAEQAESEFRQAGFDIIGHIDFLPYYSMWRLYILSK